jgi:hypothetical protein
MNNISPISLLKEAVEKVPFVKYALGIAGVAAAIAIIKSFGIQSNHIPIIGILIMLGLMVLLFIFSSFTSSVDQNLKRGAYILVYTTIFITAVSCFLLASSVFFDFPKPIARYISTSGNEITGDIVVNACDYKDSTGVCCNCLGMGEGLVTNDNKALVQVNRAAYLVPISHDGSYEISVFYTSNESRPIQIYLDSFSVNSSACGGVTHGWANETLRRETQGEYKISKGMKLIIYRYGPLPHIRAIAFNEK